MENSLLFLLVCYQDLVNYEKLETVIIIFIFPIQFKAYFGLKMASKNNTFTSIQFKNALFQQFFSQKKLLK